MKLKFWKKWKCITVLDEVDRIHLKTTEHTIYVSEHDKVMEFKIDWYNAGDRWILREDYINLEIIATTFEKAEKEMIDVINLVIKDHVKRKNLLQFIEFWDKHKTYKVSKLDKKEG